MRTSGIAALSLLGFAAALGEEIRRGDERWGDWAFERLLRKRGPRRGRHLIGALERPEAVVVQSAAAGLIAARRHVRMAACIVVAPLLALGVTAVVKSAFRRPRPLSHLFRKHGFESFPSSHTAGKAALAWILAIGFPAKKKTRVALATLAALDVAAVASARIADGAHWPTDTLAGAALGLATAEAVAAICNCPRSD